MPPSLPDPPTAFPSGLPPNPASAAPNLDAESENAFRSLDPSAYLLSFLSRDARPSSLPLSGSPKLSLRHDVLPLACPSGSVLLSSGCGVRLICGLTTTLGMSVAATTATNTGQEAAAAVGKLSVSVSSPPISNPKLHPQLHKDRVATLEASLVRLLTSSKYLDLSSLVLDASKLKNPSSLALPPNSYFAYTLHMSIVVLSGAESDLLPLLLTCATSCLCRARVRNSSAFEMISDNEEGDGGGGTVSLRWDGWTDSDSDSDSDSWCQVKVLPENLPIPISYCVIRGKMLLTPDELESKVAVSECHPKGILVLNPKGDITDMGVEYGVEMDEVCRVLELGRGRIKEVERLHLEGVGGGT